MDIRNVVNMVDNATKTRRVICVLSLVSLPLTSLLAASSPKTGPCEAAKVGSQQQGEALGPRDSFISELGARPQAQLIPVSLLRDTELSPVETGASVKLR